MDAERRDSVIWVVTPKVPYCMPLSGLSFGMFCRVCGAVGAYLYSVNTTSSLVSFH